ncbi:hypothetical protein DTO164E3_878 [Paecilomyces variotii]|nr:hypothetical protein DTO164E3_878 [Paecilomyces variotii]KAJ9351495.1 hypothetical protein DTO027B9_6296 [Paecilomyces variotii]
MAIAIFNTPTLAVASPMTLIGVTGVCLVAAILINILKQLLWKDPRKPPVVFHWFPVLGNTISYGMDPFKFFFDCKEKYGDVFTFILLGKPTTVCLGANGNNFVLNGKLSDLSAEEIYSPLTTPVFGKDVVFDCPNSKLMQQKKFVKFGLTTEALRSHVKLISLEVENFISTSAELQGETGTLNVPLAMAELTLYTAARSLQGKEIRSKLDSTFADLFHDLDMGFVPINFMLPWAPLPHNRARDRAQRKMTEVYMEIIQERRRNGHKKDSEDMIWNLMSCEYKDGTPLPDKEIAHMMIALLMGGHHSSSSTISFILLRIASEPDILEELYREQQQVFGPELGELTYEGLLELKLHRHTVRETLRLHNPIHSILRKVKNPLILDGTSYVIPPSHTVLATPATSARDPQYFPNPMKWDPHRWETRNAHEDEEEDPEDPVNGSSWSKGSGSPYLPFGAGRHRCIGEQFAYLQMGVVLAILVRNFKFRNVDGVKGVPKTDFSSLFSRPLAPAKIAWEKRTGVKV